MTSSRPRSGLWNGTIGRHPPATSLLAGFDRQVQHLADGAQIARNTLVGELLQHRFQFRDGAALAIFPDPDLLIQDWVSDPGQALGASRNPPRIAGLRFAETAVAQPCRGAGC